MLSWIGWSRKSTSSFDQIAYHGCQWIEKYIIVVYSEQKKTEQNKPDFFIYLGPEAKQYINNKLRWFSHFKWPYIIDLI